VKVFKTEFFQTQLLVNTTSGSGLDFHYKKQLLFWSDIETRKVYSVKMSDTTTATATATSPLLENARTTEIYIPGVTTWSPVSIAVDWIGEKLYVVDSVGQKIDIFELDGRNHAIVLGHNLTNPSDIALDPTKG
jgi:low density lipoprotein-related protein 2